MRVMYRTTFLAFLVAFVLCFVSVSSTSAFNLFGDACSEPRTQDAAVCQEANKSQTDGNNSIYGPNGVVSTIVTILSMIIGFAAVVMIIVAGMQYMLSNGDATKISNAKNTIIYAVIGLAVAVLARTLVVFVIERMP